MTKGFADDAVRWESGELSLDELEARHPGRDVRGLADLSGRFAAIAESPTPDPEASWTALRDRLPVRMWTPERVQRRVRRSLVAAAAAAMLAGTSIAYAAGVEPVRHQVDRIVSSVVDLVSGEDAGNSHDGDQGNAGRSGDSVDQGSSDELGNSDEGGQGNTGEQAGSDQGGADQSGEVSTGGLGSGQDDQGSSGDQRTSEQGGTEEGGQANEGGGQ